MGRTSTVLVASSLTVKIGYELCVAGHSPCAGVSSVGAIEFEADSMFTEENCLVLQRDDVLAVGCEHDPVDGHS